jgi:hypothetical protein
MIDYPWIPFPIKRLALGEGIGLALAMGPCFSASLFIPPILRILLLPSQPAIPMGFFPCPR